MSAVDTIRSFKLSDSFLDDYRDKQPAWGYSGLGYVVYKRTYARTKPDGQLEEFWETCRRVVEGTYDVQKKHCKSLRLPWDDRKAQRSAQEMFRRMWAFKWLPPGRGLWMMGSPAIERLGGAALNNCLEGNTEVFTLEHGLVRLADLPMGRSVRVWTTNGWQIGIPKSFGEQTLNTIKFKPCSVANSRTSLRYEVKATANHGWLLADGTKTYSLKIGDKVAACAVERSAGDADSLEALRHGYVFADGTLAYAGKQHNRYQLRLCGKKKSALAVFVDADVTYPESYAGDPVVRFSTASAVNLKSLPDTEDLCYHTAFLTAWMEFDGYQKDSSFCLDTIDPAAVEYVKKYAPLVGKTVVGVSSESTSTNLGERNSPLLRIKLAEASDTFFYVSDILEDTSTEEVYCFEVPDCGNFVLAGGIHSLNCGFVSTKGIQVDFADPFCWLMDMLMLGVGVGFDTKGANLVKVQKPNVVPGSFVVEDSREGWVALLRVVLDAHVGRGSIPETIDYSKVRPAGEPIRGFGGVASGPDPLKELVASVQEVLEPLQGQLITSIAITDICNLIGRCVVAGNVRRSAEIAFGDPSDWEFLNLKNPEINQEALMHHRWASNNSVFATVGMDYTYVAELTAKNGEPGYQWLDNARMYGRMGGAPDYSDMRVAGANPCVEQSLEDRELCCLVETFPGNHESFEDYKKTLKYAYLYAKSVTLIPTHDDRTNTVMMRNRRIGCSMSGIVQAMQKFGRRTFLSEFCDNGYHYLRDLDRVYSDWLCVRTSIKITSVKPSGTVSLLPGVTPGIHYPHAEYYVRRVRLQESSPLVEKLRNAGYFVEVDKYSPNTVVASFPVHEKNFDRSKEAVSMWEQLELAAQMQQFWADNQVSITVTFSKSEAQDIKHALELYETRLKGVSFLPLEDHGFEQAPYETITREQYESLSSNIRELDTKDAKHETTSRFCDGDMCVIN